MGIIFIMEKAAIFIDAGYWTKVLKSNFDSCRVDLGSVSNFVCQTLGFNRLRTYFYHCMPVVRKNNQSDVQRHAAMQKYIDKLKKLPRFEVKLGRLQCINGVFKQKMVDILMSLDIVDMCFDKKIDHAVLFAGDSDFVPAVKKPKIVVRLYTCFTIRVPSIMSYWSMQMNCTLLTKRLFNHVK